MPASTLQQVAALAGVSPATASRVLNGSSRRPGPEVSERVRQAALELGYVPNAQAQALARSSTGLLGLVVHDISDPYFSSIARGVQDASRERNKVTLLASTGGTPLEEQAAVATFAARRADAIIIAGTRTKAPGQEEDNRLLAKEIERYCANGGRVVSIGQPVVGAEPRKNLGSVRVPNAELAGLLARRLVEAGHRNFLVLAGPEGLTTSDERLAGFQEGLAAAGAGPAQVHRTAFNRDGGYAAALRLAEAGDAGKDGPTRGDARPCVFAVNDVMAIGAIAGFRQAGLYVPEDLAVAGFDDIETLRDFLPALSTVRLPLADIGRRAVEAALNGADDDGAGPVHGEVVLRRSTDL
ncbi:LacI family transcriptional regulator [Paenarthrobacter sp. DKR-5]|uniref:LacI family DNA-binding transcriptional regulator n=1 Tax=Paenarthrobacter sp. DKR-5 TaxID=2835535 RepID=UPI001BDC2FDF|nr:LacI family DNA-binding transcriptional regulator [Paenarthrobacter sp. DKR-5]MBT1002246.1 LacI family transcriptional regulator [Paenarthrobacter sp. DKR-5]